VVMRDEWRYKLDDELHYLDATCLALDVNGQ
jgi:hypothetical protein